MGLWINKSSKQFKRGIIIPSSLSVRYLTQTYGITGIFKSTFDYDNHDQDNSLLLGDMYLDFDNKENFELVREDALYALAYIKIVFGIDNKFINIYYSGNKGVHITINKHMLGVEPNKNLNYIFKSIATKINTFAKNNTLDMQIYDNKRMFRVPNSKHEDSKLFKIPLTPEELRELPEHEIKALATKPRFFRTETILSCNAADKFKWFVSNYEKILEIKLTSNKSTKSVLKYTPPCIEYILENGANSGERNNTLAILASFYNSKGLEIKETIKILQEWNSRLPDPLHDREVIATTFSMYRSGKSFGCSTIKRIYSECNKTCKFFKEGGNKSGN